jgi:glyoxylase-like metal-dependent hydrolase (beta-lactamase superfamily II)
MKILELTDELYLVDLPQNKEGFRKFISTWVFKSGNRAFLVDVGTSSSIKKLIEALEYLEIKRVEFILLTHIHIDHAGGLGDFLEHHPEAKVVVHEKGEAHLINPEKLWKGSISVLGDLAYVYGEIKPIPEDKILRGGIEFEGDVIEVIKTPGHAVHHQSYVFDKFLFAGEALGVHQYLKVKDFYMRPATPPKFVYEIARESIEKLLDFKNKTVCFGHFGYEDDSGEIAKIALEQLDTWVDVVRDVACEKGFENGEEKKVLEACRDQLMKIDKIFARYEHLDGDMKPREDYFIGNTLKGILGYVREKYCPD